MQSKNLDFFLHSSKYKAAIAKYDQNFNKAICKITQTLLAFFLAYYIAQKLVVGEFKLDWIFKNEMGFSKNEISIYWISKKWDF